MINDILKLSLQLRRVRDAIQVQDTELAYQELLKIADPTGDKLDPWAEIENLADEAELEEAGFMT